MRPEEVPESRTDPITPQPAQPEARPPTIEPQQQPAMPDLSSDMAMTEQRPDQQDAPAPVPERRRPSPTERPSPPERQQPIDQPDQQPAQSPAEAVPERRETIVPPLAASPERQPQPDKTIPTPEPDELLPDPELLASVPADMPQQQPRERRRQPVTDAPTPPERRLPPPQPEQTPQPPAPTAKPSEAQPDNLPQPEFKRIGQPGGGAPRRRNEASSTKVIGEDPSMKLLKHRYGEYYRIVGERLEQSLRRQEILFPMRFGRGAVRVQFGIAPDGTISYLKTIQAPEELVNERMMSEQVVREAGPFPPLTTSMAKDELLQKLTVTIHFL